MLHDGCFGGEAAVRVKRQESSIKNENEHYHRFLVAHAHNISMAISGCVWSFMVTSWLKKNHDDAVDITVAEEGAIVGEMCV